MCTDNKSSELKWFNIVCWTNDQLTWTVTSSLPTQHPLTPLILLTRPDCLPIFFRSLPPLLESNWFPGRGDTVRLPRRKVGQRVRAKCVPLFRYGAAKTSSDRCRLSVRSPGFRRRWSLCEGDAGTPEANFSKQTLHVLLCWCACRRLVCVFDGRETVSVGKCSKMRYSVVNSTFTQAIGIETST